MSDTQSDVGSADFSSRLAIALQGRSVPWLARTSGVGDAAIRKYLKGSQPTILPVTAMADALGVRIAWLVANRGPMVRRSLTKGARG